MVFLQTGSQNYKKKWIVVLNYPLTILIFKYNQKAIKQFKLFTQPQHPLYEGVDRNLSIQNLKFGMKIYLSH